VLGGAMINAAILLAFTGACFLAAFRAFLRYDLR
jgi:hypothetical protein